MAGVQAEQPKALVDDGTLARARQNRAHTKSGAVSTLTKFCKGKHDKVAFVDSI